MTRKIMIQMMMLLLSVIITGCGGQKSMSVAEVIQNAAALDGKTIRVRGVAYLWIKPSLSEMWTYGGCIPSSAGKPKWDAVIGWLTLYEAINPDDMKNFGAPHDKTGIRISDSNFNCDGNVCELTCQPFVIASHQTYEFAGTLRIVGEGEKSELILESLDLDASRHLVDEKWEAVPTGEFLTFFP